MSVCGLTLLGTVLGAAEWSPQAVALGVVLDTSAVSTTWVVLHALAPQPAEGSPPRSSPSVLLRALLLVSSCLAFGAFATLSVACTVLGAVVLIALSPVSVEWISGRGRRSRSSRSIATGATS